jgi:cyclohexa-1,5-dienecarbonyl-CoA hydratase
MSVRLNVRTELLDAGIGALTFGAPPLNILTRALLAELRGGLERLCGERTLRALVLDTEGPHFSAGADVGEHLAPEFRAMIPEFLDTVLLLARFPVPVIAVVRGQCLGGGFELAQAADLIVAEEGARFGQPEILLAVFPPAACALLPRRCPRGLAAEILFTGDPIDAQRALAAGLVNRVAPGGSGREQALALAARIARHSGAALRATKRALALGEAGGEAGLRGAEALYLGDLMETRDANEGLRAFVEKRRPAWTHG